MTLSQSISRIPTWVWFSFVLAASAVPRLVALRTSSVFHDEAWSILCARLPIADMIGLIRADAGEPVYFLVLKLWIALFGWGEISAASLSTLLSLVNIGLVFWFARRLFGDGVGLLAALFLGFNWLDFHFSTHIRFYPLLMTVTILSYSAFLAALRRERSIGWFALISLIGFYTHSYYWFICFSQFLVLLACARADIPRFLLAGVPVALAYAPWFFLVFLHQMTGYVSSYMDSNLERVDGPLRALWILGASFVSKHSMPAWIGPFALVAAAAFVANTVRRRRDRGEVSSERQAVLMLIVFYGGAVGTPIAISMVKPIYWINHYDVALVPISATLLAYAVYRLDSGRLAKGARVLLCMAIPVLALPYMRWEITAEMDGDRQSVQRLADELRDDDIIIATGLSYVQTKYYLDLYGLAYKELILYPPDLTAARPQYLRSRYKREPEARDALPAHVADLADALDAGGFRRIYVFYQDDDVAAYLKRELDSRFAAAGELPVLRHPWGPVHDSVLIYEKREQTGPGV